MAAQTSAPELAEEGDSRPRKRRCSAASPQEPFSWVQRGTCGLLQSELFVEHPAGLYLPVPGPTQLPLLQPFVPRLCPPSLPFPLPSVAFKPSSNQHTSASLPASLASTATTAFPPVSEFQPGSTVTNRRHHARMQAQRQRRDQISRCQPFLITCAGVLLLTVLLPEAQNSLAECRGLFHRIARSADFVEADFVNHRQISRDPHTLRLTIGSPVISCGHCKALHWLLEKTSGTDAASGFGMCCYHGKVQLPPLQPTPPILQQLLTANTAAAKHFRANIRMYNSIFQMASTGMGLYMSGL